MVCVLVLLFGFYCGVVEDGRYAEQACDVFECRGSLPLMGEFAEQFDAAVGDFDFYRVFGDRCVPG